MIGLHLEIELCGRGGLWHQQGSHARSSHLGTMYSNCSVKNWWDLKAATTLCFHNLENRTVASKELSWTNNSPLGTTGYSGWFAAYYISSAQNLSTLAFALASSMSYQIRHSERWALLETLDLSGLQSCVLGTSSRVLRWWLYEVEWRLQALLQDRVSWRFSLIKIWRLFSASRIGITYKESNLKNKRENLRDL